MPVYIFLGIEIHMLAVGKFIYNNRIWFTMLAFVIHRIRETLSCLAYINNIIDVQTIIAPSENLIFTSESVHNGKQLLSEFKQQYGKNIEKLFLPHCVCIKNRFFFHVSCNWKQNRGEKRLVCFGFQGRT